MTLKQRIQRIEPLYRLLSWGRWYGGRLFMRACHAFLPLKRNAVLFSSYSGRSYSDNSRCVSETLHALCPNAEIVWQLNRHVDRSDVPDYVHVIPAHSLTALRYYATVRAFADNMNRPQYMLKFKDQYYVQLWHGDRGFKKVLMDMGTGEPFPDGYQMDLAVAGSDFGARVYRSALDYKGEILLCGCPRNDFLFHYTQEDVEGARKALGLDADTRVLLYAPTFRDANAESKMHTDLHFDKLKARLEATYGGHWVCLSHSHVRNTGVDNSFLRDVSDFPDVYRLMLVADMLITDYSSIGGDYMLLKRPTIYYQPDLQDYLSERGLYYDPDQSPLLAVHSEEALLKLLEKPVDAEANCRVVFEYLGLHESGEASKTVAERIAAQLG